MNEIWKNVPGYEDYYQVSNLGNVKSLPKEWISGNGALLSHNGKTLKSSISSSGYYMVVFCVNSIKRTFNVHQLVAMAFLNHTPNGLVLVIDHINDDRLDNKLENLQIVTSRFNVCKTQGRYTSKYKGVVWHKASNKWMAQMHINGKATYLGLFENEIDAHNTYQNKLKEII